MLFNMPLLCLQRSSHLYTLVGVAVGSQAGNPTETNTWALVSLRTIRETNWFIDLFNSFSTPHDIHISSAWLEIINLLLRPWVQSAFWTMFLECQRYAKPKRCSCAFLNSFSMLCFFVCMLIQIVDKTSFCLVLACKALCTSSATWRNAAKRDKPIGSNDWVLMLIG